MPGLALQKNLNFMVLEVSRQVDATLDFLMSGDKDTLQKIICRDDYLDNLKTIIEKRCFGILSETKNIAQKETDRIHATHTISVNLERIGDFCVSIAKQVGYLHDFAILSRFNYQFIFEVIEDHLPLVIPVLEEGDLPKALAICRSEHQIDMSYKENFDQIMDELRSARNIEDLVTVLFIFRYLERIGDALLNIGEALLLSILGEKIKINQFQALEETLTKTGLRGSLSEVDFSSILGSRSGCRIRKLSSESDKLFLPQAQSSIFKEGVRDKIHAEKVAIEQWERFFPGLCPKIFSYQETEDNASLLAEYIPGYTLEEIILAGKLDDLHIAFTGLRETVQAIWEKTRDRQPVKIDYVEQLLSRLDSILSVHPDFYRSRQDIGATKVDSSQELLEKCLSIEEELRAPFSVFIHGDFNVNNIIYNGATERIHFIDLYRSRQADYIQDVSVFIVSNFRQPAFNIQLRDRLNWVIRNMYDLARAFAQEHNDTTFEVRMAFALARSLYTSTRFELNTDFAREMFLRAHFLLEKILSHEGKAWEKFKLPTGVLFY